jgi:kumamolisin
MKRFATSFVVLLVFAAAPMVMAQGQGPAHAPILIPDSSVEHPEDIGFAAHTNHVIRLAGPPAAGGPSGETPQSLRAVYNLPALGGANTIIIVDAFHYPTSLNDFNVFSSQFGLPVETSADPLNPANKVFQVVYATGSQPRKNCGWAQEAALDIEWAHAMAPSAKIVLVEAATNSFTNLFNAVDVGSQQPGASELSMSWGGSEFASEAGSDSHMVHAGTVYFASSGDTGGVTIYPGVSPNVVSAGGTRVNRDAAGAFVSETGWSGSGGGPSTFEPRPGYQLAVANIVGTQRGVPDFSFDADPATGVSVFDSTPCQGLSGWLVFGGTSVASPSLAGIVNLAGHFATSSNAELTTIYSNLGNALDFRDITSGTAGSFSCAVGWDFVTGVGSNQGTLGK